jgi:hypothetical protein
MLAEAEISVGPYTQSAFQPFIGPLLGIRFSPLPFILGKIQARYAFYLLSLQADGLEVDGEVRISLWDFASLSVRGSRKPDGIDGGLGVYFYF